MVDALIHELHDVEQRTGTGAARITVRKDSGRSAATESGPRYTVELDNGETLLADDIYVTVQNFAAAGLLRPHVDVSALDDVNYVSVANVVMAFAKKDIVTEYDGSGFLVPRKEGRNITACLDFYQMAAYKP